jgi:hypothetical protein
VWGYLTHPLYFINKFQNTIKQAPNKSQYGNLDDQTVQIVSEFGLWNLEFVFYFFVIKTPTLLANNI